jgi:hypothetical protein
MKFVNAEQFMEVERLARDIYIQAQGAISPIGAWSRAQEYALFIVEKAEAYRNDDDADL